MSTVEKSLTYLESLLQEGLEINLCCVPMDNKSGMRRGKFGVVVYDPGTEAPSEFDMDDCEYGKTLEEVLEKAVRRW